MAVRQGASQLLRLAAMTASSSSRALLTTSSDVSKHAAMPALAAGALMPRIGGAGAVRALSQAAAEQAPPPPPPPPPKDPSTVGTIDHSGMRPRHANSSAEPASRGRWQHLSPMCFQNHAVILQPS